MFSAQRPTSCPQTEKAAVIHYTRGFHANKNGHPSKGSRCFHILEACVQPNILSGRSMTMCMWWTRVFIGLHPPFPNMLGCPELPLLSHTGCEKSSAIANRNAFDRP